MLHVDSVPVLEREGAEILIRYAPVAAADCTIELTSDTALKMSVISAEVDGEAIAFEERRHAGGVTVAAGWLEVAITLRIWVTPHIPVRSRSAMLVVKAGIERHEVAFALASGATFLPARSRLRVSQTSAAPGDALTLHVDTTNDGTAVAAAPFLHLRIPSLVTLEAAGESWVEVEPDGARALVIPLDSIDVGERMQRNISVRLGQVAVDRTVLRFEARLVVDGKTFEFAPAEIEVRSSAQAAAHIRLIEPRPYRFGERVLAIVGVDALGTDVVRSAKVRLAAEGIAWAGQAQGAIDFGTIAPFAQTARLIEGEIVATPSGEERIVVHAFGSAESGEVSDASMSVVIAGTPRIYCGIAVTEADESKAHIVTLTVANRGDGAAHSLRVKADLPPGVVAVVDSLKVDGVARWSLDGSVCVLAGEEFGPLSVGATRTIAWRVRSDASREAAVRASVEADGSVDVLEALCVFADGTRIDEPAALPPQEVPNDPFGSVPAEMVPEEPDVVVTRDELLPAPRVRYEISSETTGSWNVWHCDDSADLEIGRLVLAARAFLPAASAVPAADAAIAGIRSECRTVHAARLEAYRQTGVFAASGFDFATTLLRKAVRSYYAALDEEAGDLDGTGLDRALIRTIGAVGTPLAALVEEFRDELLRTLGAMHTILLYGERAPERLLHAASRLSAALATAEVA